MTDAGSPRIEAQPPQLRRRLGLFLLTFHAVGVMVGAGIYVLIGEMAREAGMLVPLAFALAALVALPTVLSYAELATRLPEAAGAALYVARGFGSERLGVVIGLFVIFSGIVSAAAVLQGGVGYLTSILPIPALLGVVTILVLLTLLAIIGVLESISAAVLFTFLEIGGLILVSSAGLLAEPVPQPAMEIQTGGLAKAVLLAFFAYIGFEDVVNLAEEAREPSRTMPRALIFGLLIVAALYMLTSLAAIRAVPIPDLASSPRPLALVWERATGSSAGFLSGIAILAALNGVLAQLVMGARILFGLGRRSPALGFFHEAHPRFRTPVRATLVVAAAVLAFALFLPIGQLAQISTAMLLAVFILVNLALYRLKRLAPEAPFRTPVGVPLAGAGLSLLVLLAWALGLGGVH